MSNGYWVPHREACVFYGVSDSTLRRWANNNQIKYKRNPSGQRSYFLFNNSNQIFETPKKTKSKIPISENYVYCRVSSRKQADDLERQCSFLRHKYPNYKIIKDIGSGLNYKRPGLLKLLDLSNKGTIREIVVASKDRLCRFGYELLEWQFLQNDTKLVVLEQNDKTPEQEFTEDILAILQVFACRWNSKRRYTIKNKENQVEINIDTKKNFENMVVS